MKKHKKNTIVSFCCSSSPSQKQQQQFRKCASRERQVWGGGLGFLPLKSQQPKPYAETRRFVSNPALPLKVRLRKSSEPEDGRCCAWGWADAAC
jgi:hypothetical protein